MNPRGKLNVMNYNHSRLLLIFSFSSSLLLKLSTCLLDLHQGEFNCNRFVVTVIEDSCEVATKGQLQDQENNIPLC